VFERVAAAGSPVLEDSASQPSVATTAARGLPPAFPRLRANEADPALRTGFAAVQRAVTARRMVSRDQDPGPPDMPDVWGLQCGIKDGKPTCTMNTPKGDVDVDPDTLSPDDKKAAFDPRRPKDCQPERWNWFWQSCCATGKRFDAKKKSCVPVPREKEFDFGPPPPAPEKGDFPLPDPNQAVA
jgi:hypothetical protein